ncbi:hypothetical protein LTR08_001399 [Meristemomyces frigidus]|nr:hypothetical protein LTR08_001399 [Meristemomyces frigidus]
MAFLKRSKSQMVRTTREVEKEAEALPWSSVSEQNEAVKDERLARFERRRSIFNRSKSANRAVERKEELRALGETIEIREGGDTYNFPTPSPRLPRKAPAFEAAPAPSPLTGYHTTPVGVAIGSPAAQVLPRWGRSHTVSHGTPAETSRQPLPPRAHTTVTALPVLPDPTPKPPEIRKKKSGWKTLGSLFRSHAPKPTVQETFHQVRAAPEQPRPSMHARPLIETPLPSPPTLQSPASNFSHHSRNSSVSRGMARVEARAEADRASFLPNVTSRVRQGLVPVGRQSFLPPLKQPVDNRNRDSENMFTTLQQDRLDSPMSDKRVGVPGAVPRTPKLDLAIPNGEMERYSVMFEKLLEPRQSIVERRQSKHKRLKIVAKEESSENVAATFSQAGQRPTEIRIPGRLKVKSQPAVVLLPQRSISSPHLNKVQTPRISVTKQGGTSADAPVAAIHRPRPIVRSKTAPPGAISPVARNFSRPKAQAFDSSDSDTSPLDGENSIPTTPTTIATVTDTDATPYDHPKPIKPRHLAIEDAEPSWDMLTSRPAALHHNNSGHGMLREPYPRVTSPEDLERQIVQVSIARQVSVSRARKHVQQAVASKQPLRPRVVELSRHRKSTFVVIEGGDS